MKKKHKRTNNRSARSERALKFAKLKLCDAANEEVLETLTRKETNKEGKGYKKIYVDPRQCPMLYNNPTLTPKDAQNYMRHSQYRVMEKDLKLY